MPCFYGRRSKVIKIFISWSGTKSQEVAKILKQWIPCVIQSVEPYFSSADIDKGARWSTDIAKELQDASFGILCVTKDNLSSSWLNFEAGALSKSIEQSKVCPFLVDLKPSDIQNSPILQFQMASASKDDVFKLFNSINSNLGDGKLAEAVLETTFETFWPKIEDALKSVSSTPEVSKPTSKPSQITQDPIEEILELVRYQHKLLKSPEELFPPSYLIDIFRRSSKMPPKGFLMELDEQLHMIDMVTSDLLEDYKVKPSFDLETSRFHTEKLQELQRLVHRISISSRRYLKNQDFML